MRGSGDSLTPGSGPIRLLGIPLKAYGPVAGSSEWVSRQRVVLPSEFWAARARLHVQHTFVDVIGWV